MKTILKNGLSISVIINSKLGILRDRTHADINEIDRWINETISQTPEDAQSLKERCEVCGSKEDRKNLELHHIAGRKHDYRTITACKACHSQLSAEQGMRDARWLHEAPPSLQAAFFLHGLKDILILKGQRICNSHYSDLGAFLANETAQILRGD